MHWKIMATVQKILSTSKIGDKINHLSVLTNKMYQENIFIYQFYECLRK